MEAKKEDSDVAAYRELKEETGLTRRQIHLYRLMDIRYYYQDFTLELYVGKLDEDIPLQEEKNPRILFFGFHLTKTSQIGNVLLVIRILRIL